MRQLKTSTGFVLTLIDGENKGSGIPMGNLRIAQPNEANDFTIDSNWFAEQRKNIVRQLTDKQYNKLMGFNNLNHIRTFILAIEKVTNKRSILIICDEIVEKLNEVEHNQLKRGV